MECSDRGGAGWRGGERKDIDKGYVYHCGRFKAGGSILAILFLCFQCLYTVHSLKI